MPRSHPAFLSERPIRGQAIRLSTRIKLAVALWLAAEALAFYLVAELVGYPEALLIAFVTSLFGWTLLKRVGAAAAVKLRAFVNGRRLVEGESHRFADETLASLGALALLLPGFLSDAVGLVLAVPAARHRLAGWLGAGTRSPLGPPGRDGHKSPAPQTIDLEPGEWRHGEASRHPASKT